MLRLIFFTGFYICSHYCYIKGIEVGNVVWIYSGTIRLTDSVFSTGLRRSVIVISEQWSVPGCLCKAHLIGR